MSGPAVALAAGLAVVAARGIWAGVRAAPPGGAARWDRTNHRGETLTLLEGPAYTLAAATAVGLTPGLPRRLRAAAVLATLGGGLFGAIDDLHETGRSKGLRGHLGELARGHVTTGGLKVLGIGGTGLLAAALAGPPRPAPTSGSRIPRALEHAPQTPVIMHARTPRHTPQTPVIMHARTPGRLLGRANVHDHREKKGTRLGVVADVLVGGGLIAGTANLLNLFDLRPGRALKVVLLTAPVAARGGSAGRLVAAATGAAAALLPPDLAEQAMLGDTGANAAGALLGTAAVAGLGRRGRLAVLAGVAALTLASEKVSFTQVIARTPGLREFDALGRRPPQTGPGSQG